MSRWKSLGSVDAQHLVNARLQSHWAVQLAAGVGKRLLPPQPDVSEQSFEWIEKAGLLAQGLVSGKRAFRSGLRLADLTLVLADEAGSPIKELPLSGHTLEEAHAWLTAEVEKLLSQPLAGALELPAAADMPAHPVGAGRRFALADPAPFAELGRWYADADLLLREIARAEPGASPVRCWPHHFDLATLLKVGDGKDAESTPTVGLGLSPGDGGRPAPYFYVTPWPYPKNPELSPLAGGGTWNTEGWLGAVLDASAFLGSGGAADQEGSIRQFLHSALAASRRLATQP
ncbi:MAG TPA: hypothetical protein VMM92_07245 [Thermoanaerobaculia bacterium]|nr:hypothetical protein [Thermoanaerobaculia bacterium]